MKPQRTDSKKQRPIKAGGRLCRTCGLGSVSFRQCSCCGDWWLVCEHCEAAHARIGAVG